MKPLVFIKSCGATKAKGVVPAKDKYIGTPWLIFRKYEPENRKDAMRLFIISAKFGLIPEDKGVCDYNKELSLREKKLKNHQIYYKNLVPLLKRQIKEYGLEGSQIFVDGSAPYNKALEEAKLPFISLVDLFSKETVVGREMRGGQGKKNAALKWFLLSYYPTLIQERNIIHALKQRFKAIGRSDV